MCFVVVAIVLVVLVYDFVNVLASDDEIILPARGWLSYLSCLGGGNSSRMGGLQVLRRPLQKNLGSPRLHAEAQTPEGAPSPWDALPLAAEQGE